ncbi:hypothetical protein B0T21DRAFT_423599, partial [Apiosordaria backusii]
CAVAGAILTKTGRYKPLHWAGFGILAVSCGLFSTMSPSTQTVAWAWFQILAGIGIGFPLTTQLPAIQAVLPESDTAISTSTYSFIRSFGFVWGATIPSIIFTVGLMPRWGLETVRASLANGGAYSYAPQVRHLTVVWLAGLGFALFGFLLVFLERHVDMRVTLETEFGLEERPKRGDSQAQNEEAMKPS